MFNADKKGVFAITLETGKTWIITAGIKKKDSDTIIFSDKYETTLSTENPVLNHTFNPVPVTEGKGSIKLKMSVPNGTTKVTAECSDSGWSDAAPSVAFVLGDGFTLKASSINTGAYTVVLNFYDSNNILLYTTVQAINVFAGLTTNSWRSNGSTDSLIDSTTGEFKLTQDICNSFARTIFYVGDTSVGSVKKDDEGNDIGTGSAYSPLASLNRAMEIIAATGNESSKQDYKIFVTGTIKGNQGILNTVNNKAKSITIEGFRGLSDGIPQDVLDGNNTGSVLTINTSVPVTIKDLKITGGYGANGGGIYMGSGTSITLESGTLVGDATESLATSSDCGNKASSAGGGIYNNGGTLTLKKGSKVCHNYAGYSDSDTDSGGGGIASAKGKVIIEAGASVSYNRTGGRGGGIYLIGTTSESTLTMNGGEISYNATGYWGGGVLIGSGSTAAQQGENCNVRFYMKGGEICNNKSTSEDYGWGPGGGGVTVDHSYMEMSGSAKIHHNEASNTGGGLRVGLNGVFLMSGGEISNNTCHRETDTDGTPVSGGALDIEPNSKVVISGSAKIPYGIDGVKGYRKNDIWLRYASDETPSYITVGGALTSTFEMGIGVNGKRGLVIAQADGTNVTDLTTYKDYFKIINTDWLTNLSSKTKIVLDSPIYVAGKDTHPVCKVAGKSAAEGGKGTEKNPFDSIASAIAEINRLNASTDYTILIDGELRATTVNNNETIDGYAQEISDPVDGSTIKAKSITIRGASASNGNPTDVINGLSADGTKTARGLNIDTKIPVTIENLKITGGLADNGGGIYLSVKATTLTLGNDVLITGNKAKYSGGGIYLNKDTSNKTPTLNIKGNVKICDNTNSVSGDPSNLYLPDGAKITITGALTKGSDMAKIGISTEIDPTSETAVTVTSGYSSYNPGVNPGVYFRGDKYGVKEGSGDAAGDAVISPSGGALIVESLYKNIQIKADKTSFSKAALPKTINFTAVAIADDGTEIDSPLTIAASGDNNVVISAKLSYHGESVKSDFYSVGTGSLELKSGLAFGDYTLYVSASYKGRSYSASFPIVIRETVGTKSSSQEKAVGDIVFNDGSAMPYTEYAALDDDSKNDLKTKAIALIFYNGTGLNSGSDTTTKRTLGMGLGCGEILPWCSDSSSSRYKQITPICCYATGGFPPNIEFTTTGQDDRNGSDNLEQIADFLGTDNDTSIEENYPVLYWAKNYKDCILPGESSSRIKSGSAFENGWYLPSSAELYMFWKNGIYENAELDLNTASQALGGIDFTNKTFMTSSQSASSQDYVDALWLTIYAGNTDIMSGAKDGSTNPGYPIAIREF